MKPADALALADIARHVCRVQVKIDDLDSDSRSSPAGAHFPRGLLLRHGLITYTTFEITAAE